MPHAYVNLRAKYWRASTREGGRGSSLGRLTARHVSPHDHLLVGTPPTVLRLI